MGQSLGYKLKQYKNYPKTTKGLTPLVKPLYVCVAPSMLPYLDGSE